MNLSDEARKRGKPLKILVTRLRFLGDVIITTPVISSLKRRYPEASIYYLAQGEYGEILRNHPALDGIISLGDGFIEFVRTAARLRKMCFTAALDLFYNPASANLLFLSGIPVRIGGRRSWRRRLYTETFKVPGDVKSAVDHHLYALRLFDCSEFDTLPKIYLSDDEIGRGRAILREQPCVSARGGRIVTIHPGGTWPSKMWPAGSYTELARRLAGDHDLSIVLLSGPGEEELTSGIAGRAGEGVSAMKTHNIRETAAVIAASDATIANDGGILHLSVALGKPTVGIFGPTEPGIWFPYEGTGPFALVTRNEDCAPCHLHFCDDGKCLAQIRPEEVEGKLFEVAGW